MCEGDDLGAMTDTLIQAGSAVKEAGFGMFREMLCYKLARQESIYSGRPVSPTTRSCSACGLTRTRSMRGITGRSGWVWQSAARFMTVRSTRQNIKARGLEQFLIYRGRTGAPDPFQASCAPP